MCANRYIIYTFSETLNCERACGILWIPIKDTTYYRDVKSRLRDENIRLAAKNNGCI